MNAIESRIGPTLHTDPERSMLPNVDRLLKEKTSPKLVSDTGEVIELPESVYQTMKYIVSSLMRGQAIVLVPETESYTTQAAAEYLGMSRQHFVNLLEAGKIPFHKVGAHRRVQFKDLQTYDNARNTSRRSSLDALFRSVRDAGLDDASYKGAAEG